MFLLLIAFEYSSGECVETTPLAITAVDPAVGGPPIRRSLADTQTHTKCVLFCLFFTFLFYLLWMLRSNKRAMVDVIEFCVLFVDLRCADLKRKQ